MTLPVNYSPFVLLMAYCFQIFFEPPALAVALACPALTESVFLVSAAQTAVVVLVNTAFAATPVKALSSSSQDGCCLVFPLFEDG